MPNAAVYHLIQIAAGDLRFSPKYGIAAADISHHRVDASLYISQCNAVFFARLTTVQFACALSQKAAKNTMLGVENGQVLECNNLHACAADTLC